MYVYLQRDQNRPLEEEVPHTSNSRCWRLELLRWDGQTTQGKQGAPSSASTNERHDTLPLSRLSIRRRHTPADMLTCNPSLN